MYLRTRQVLESGILSKPDNAMARQVAGSVDRAVRLRQMARQVPLEHVQDAATAATVAVLPESPTDGRFHLDLLVVLSFAAVDAALVHFSQRRF